MGKNKLPKKPFVSVCTPTFNRRPFIPIIIKCFENQTYPRDKMEWIIIDDGTDKIEDLVAHLPYVKYFKYDIKMTLGKKRNISNEKATGDIIIYMDDDDYYPPQRVSHAVDRLKNSKALCAGSSAMFMYFKHINKMYQFGPYGPNHSTAATFAFKRELLNQTKFNEESSVAEEKQFLKQYTVPFVQLDSEKSILVFSHNHNSFDKKELLKQLPNPTIHETEILPNDLVKEPEILKFFMEDIDELIEKYEPGKIEFKPDVQRQIQKMKVERENKIQEFTKKQTEYNDTISKISQLMNPESSQKKINEQSILIQQLTFENDQLKEKVEYLNNKIKTLITSQLEKRQVEKV
jgi:cellulose synthase/poly-beta-1,6-N-acetylglucosamine synthase-like glycosyltransferase